MIKIQFISCNLVEPLTLMVNYARFQMVYNASIRIWMSDEFYMGEANLIVVINLSHGHIIRCQAAWSADSNRWRCTSQASVSQNNATKNLWKLRRLPIDPSRWPLDKWSSLKHRSIVAAAPPLSLIWEAFLWQLCARKWRVTRISCYFVADVGAWAIVSEGRDESRSAPLWAQTSRFLSIFGRKGWQLDFNNPSSIWYLVATRSQHWEQRGTMVDHLLPLSLGCSQFWPRIS